MSLVDALPIARHAWSDDCWIGRAGRSDSPRMGQSCPQKRKSEPVMRGDADNIHIKPVHGWPPAAEFIRGAGLADLDATLPGFDRDDIMQQGRDIEAIGKRMRKTATKM